MKLAKMKQLRSLLHAKKRQEEMALANLVQRQHQLTAKASQQQQTALTAALVSPADMHAADLHMIERYRGQLRHRADANIAHAQEMAPAINEKRDELRHAFKRENAASNFLTRLQTEQKRQHDKTEEDEREALIRLKR